MQCEAVHQGVDANAGLIVGVAGEMGVTGGGEDGVVAQYLLHLQQIDTGLDQMGCIAVAQTVWGDLFFRPQSSAT